MCGLFGGYSSILTAPERDIVQSLMALNWIRGEDSTGMMDFIPDGRSLDKGDSRWRYWKSTDHPWDFVRNRWKKADEDRWKKSSPRIIAGHARAATRGKINQANAHPFYHKPVIGMHNGTIWGSFANSPRYDTDSEALILNISEMGIDKALDDLKHANSVAYALVWMNCKENTLNFLRNDKRPLHFSMQKDGATLYWSSEASALEMATAMDKSKEPWEIMELPVNTLFTFDLNSNYRTDPEKREVKVPSAPVSIGFRNPLYQGESSWYADEAEWEKTLKAYDTDNETGNGGVARTPEQTSLPWENYPEEEEEFMSNPKVEISLGSEEGLTEPYLMQFSSTVKQGLHQNWDLVSSRWFSDWAWRRLNDVRRKVKQQKIKAPSPVVTTVTKIENSDPLNDSLPEIMKPGYEEPKIKKEGAEEVISARFQWETAAPWHVNGDVVSYGNWLQATKKGCSWDRCTLIHDADAIWINDKVVLCVSHAKEALDKNSELNAFFAPNAREIKSGLKKQKARLMNEVALRNSFLKKAN